jgi:hypothetical protein
VRKNEPSHKSDNLIRARANKSHNSEQQKRTPKSGKSDKHRARAKTRARTKHRARAKTQTVQERNTTCKREQQHRTSANTQIGRERKTANTPIAQERTLGTVFNLWEHTGLGGGNFVQVAYNLLCKLSAQTRHRRLVRFFRNTVHVGMAHISANFGASLGLQDNGHRSTFTSPRAHHFSHNRSLI